MSYQTVSASSLLCTLLYFLGFIIVSTHPTQCKSFSDLKMVQKVDHGAVNTMPILSHIELTDSFWEIGQYKRTTKRIDDGNAASAQLMQMVGVYLH